MTNVAEPDLTKLRQEIDRLDGGLFLVIWGAYMAYLIYNL